MRNWLFLKIYYINFTQLEGMFTLTKDIALRGKAKYREAALPKAFTQLF